MSMAATLFLLGSGQNAFGSESSKELATLKSLVKGFKVIDLPSGAGNIKLSPDDALTIDRLRGVKLDPDPPKLRGKAPRYKINMTDPFPADKGPYIAPGIAPFRYKYFNCEFSYGGWHNFKMTDYAATHGFNIIFPYVRKPNETAHLPAGTKIMRWGNVSWRNWAKKHLAEVPDAKYRFDKASAADMIKMAESSKLLNPANLAPVYKNHDLIMLDMEHAVISPGKLGSKSWFPKDKKQQAPFIKKYYDGYAQTYIGPVKVAKKEGWKDVGIYGWQPFGRTWGGLEKAYYEPGHNKAWELFGKQIYQSVTLVYNSVYSFYWSPQNVAYTLANIDLNTRIINAQPKIKPLRPYYWPLLHGGGGGDRWWRNQPIPLADMRAMVAMAFFSGVDGIVCWSWSGTGTHHRNPVATKKRYFKSNYVMFKNDFTAKTAKGGKPIEFKRFDVVKILNIDEKSKTATIQPAWKPNINSRGGISTKKISGETCKAAIAELNKHLRVGAEPVSSMIEGMALIKPLEYTLKHGKVMIDVPAITQFKKILPIVRRVKLGKTHVVITYDPIVIHGGKPRNIVLKDFDSVKGRMLTLPADQQTRIFVLAEK